MPGDLWPGQVRSFVEKRDHTYRAIRVRRNGSLLSVLHIVAVQSPVVLHAAADVRGYSTVIQPTLTLTCLPSRLCHASTPAVRMQRNTPCPAHASLVLFLPLVMHWHPDHSAGVYRRNVWRCVPCRFRD